jgi:hypothetical protein
VLPVADGGGAKGALGALMIGVACVVCCLPPVVAFGGVALGLAAGAAGWLAGLPTLAIAAVVALPMLIVVAVLARSAQTRSRRLAKPELHRLS